MRKTKTRKPKKTGRKQTSEPVSSLAGRWLSLLRGVKGSRAVGHYDRHAFGGVLGEIGTVKGLRSILGSELVQDETPRPKRERRVRK